MRFELIFRDVGLFGEGNFRVHTIFFSVAEEAVSISYEGVHLDYRGSNSNFI